MKKLIFILTALLMTAATMISCGGGENKEAEKTDSILNSPQVVVENALIKTDSGSIFEFVAYDIIKEGKRPVILIVPEWWGITEYTKNRARQLAELGYFAMVVDMYGQATMVDNPTDAQKLATPFYQDPQMANQRIEAAWEKAREYKQADTDNTIAIGYCFGGAMVLNAARSGFPFKGVVSFHGGLTGVRPEKNKIKADIMVCHGGADPFVPATEVEKFKTQMDSVGAKYTFKVYEGATHAFTNPEATANGKKFNLPIAYNEKADQDSWNDFMGFLDKVLKK